MTARERREWNRVPRRASFENFHLRNTKKTAKKLPPLSESGCNFAATSHFDGGETSGREAIGHKEVRSLRVCVLPLW